jgi:hypothetical protein
MAGLSGCRGRRFRSACPSPRRGHHFVPAAFLPSGTIKGSGARIAAMKISVALAAGWIAFYLADFALYGGYYAQGSGRLLQAIADAIL